MLPLAEIKEGEGHEQETRARDVGVFALATLWFLQIEGLDGYETNWVQAFLILVLFVIIRRIPRLAPED